MFSGTCSIAKMEKEKSTVIPVVVKPAEFKKLQGEVTTLEKDVADKQIVIDKLQADLTTQQQVSAALEVRIGDLESLNP